jgi:hypothetical protein
MKRRIGLGLMVAGLAMTLVVPAVVTAAGPRGGGGAGGAGIHTQTRSMDQIRTQQGPQGGQSFGSQGSPAGNANRGGNAYGPGDGTGNMGVGPKDGTGYGSPANR